MRTADAVGGAGTDAEADHHAQKSADQNLVSVMLMNLHPRPADGDGDQKGVAGSPFGKSLHQQPGGGDQGVADWGSRWGRRWAGAGAGSRACRCPSQSPRMMNEIKHAPGEVGVIVADAPAGTPKSTATAMRKAKGETFGKVSISSQAAAKAVRAWPHGEAARAAAGPGEVREAELADARHNRPADGEVQDAPGQAGVVPQARAQEDQKGRRRQHQVVEAVPVFAEYVPGDVQCGGGDDGPQAGYQ